MTIGAFLQLMVIFWIPSMCAPTGIISILIKKCSWPEALRFMEWKFIHVGRLCMPLRFTSTGWFPVWQQLGQGPKMMPKHSFFISYWMVFKKKKPSTNRMFSEDWLFIEERVKWYSQICKPVRILRFLWSYLIIKTMKLTGCPRMYFVPSQLLHYISSKVQFVVKFICFERAWLMNWTWLGSRISYDQLCPVCKGGLTVPEIVNPVVGNCD